jgi:hypothetical protein
MFPRLHEEEATMTKKRIELRLVLEVETGDAEIVGVTVEGSTFGSSLSEPMAEGVPAEVDQMIEGYAPPSLALFQRAFAERCADLGLTLQTPSGSRKYINAYPPQRYGSKRAATFDVKSGRVEIYCRPENATGRELAEVVTNNDEPFAVKVYLRSPASVDEAVALTKIGLDERGT